MPGHAIVELIDENSGWVGENKNRIIKGKILSMGIYDTTQTGERIEPERSNLTRPAPRSSPRHHRRDHSTRSPSRCSARARS